MEGRDEEVTRPLEAVRVRRVERGIGRAWVVFIAQLSKHLFHKVFDNFVNEEEQGGPADQVEASLDGWT